MTVKDLKIMLEKYPDDMEVVIERYSDYNILSEEYCEVVKAVPEGGEWAMRSHPTMSEDNKAKEKEYLHLC